MGGQEHFYLEPHGSIVVPSENDEIKIIASTQVCPSFCNICMITTLPCVTGNKLRLTQLYSEDIKCCSSTPLHG